MYRRLTIVMYLMLMAAMAALLNCGGGPSSPDKSDQWPFDTTTYTGSGDINLNGVPFEIADAVVFIDYFMYDVNAFTVNVDSQISATDVNHDGRALTAADLVYMIRHFTGDGWNWKWLRHNALTAKFDAYKSITSNAPLGAVFFEFQGNVTVGPGDGAGNMNINYNYLDDTTRVLIYSFDEGEICSGEILRTNGADIIHIDASDYYGATYKTKIIDWRNNIELGAWPNPFYPTTTVAMGFPTEANWSMTITDMTGRLAAAFNGYTEAGSVKVEWDAGGQPDGIYLCEVSADEMVGSVYLIVAR